MKTSISCLIFLFWISLLIAQPVPSVEENIPYMVTFGSKSNPSWGDDDHCQVFFFLIPSGHTAPVYIRIFDPDTGGELDELKGDNDTRVKFSVYGGQGAYSNDDARQVQPVRNYDSGNLLATKTFGAEKEYDKKWFTFGPFNPSEGEKVSSMDGYVFKVIAIGKEGNDGNLYQYFLSIEPEENKPIEGANSFTFEYTFRMHETANTSHLYPYVDKKVVSIRVATFDWDNDGIIRIVSSAKPGEKCQTSDDANWKISEHKIHDEEKGQSLDIQFIKNKTNPSKNNNVVLYITNQYDEFLPFYTSPIGGIPKFKYKIDVQKKTNKR